MSKKFLIDDNALGILLQISFDLGGEHNKYTQQRQNKSASYMSELNSLAALSKESLFSFKSTITPQTTFKLKTMAKDLKRKAKVVTGNHYGIRFLRNQSQEYESFHNHLTKLLELKSDVSDKDLSKIYKYRLGDTLLDVLEVSDEQRIKLKKFLKEYCSDYKNKLFPEQGEQNLANSHIYSDHILKTISSEYYFDLYGSSNIGLNSTKKSFFCHSVMCLYFDSKIDLLDLSSVPAKTKSDSYIKTWNARINNLSTSQNSKAWPSDFRWKNKDTYIFGEFGEKTFGGQRLKVFRESIRSKTNWALISKISLVVEKKEKEVRSIINQINSERLSDIPVSFKPREKGQGAYKLDY